MPTQPTPPIPRLRTGQRVMILTEASVYFGLIGIVEERDKTNGNYLVGFTPRQLAKARTARASLRTDPVAFFPHELEAL